MESEKISIIIPIYNLENYISKCLDSIIMQSYKNIEIIIVNDGSTDKSADICEAYAKKDSRIKVIHQANQGPSVARNTGISVANGNYISFIDADDWIEPDMIEVLYENAYKYNSDISVCNINYVTINGDIILSRDGKSPFNIYNFTDDNIVILEGYEKMIKYISQNVNLFWNKLYKKHLFDSVTLPHNNKIHQDVLPTWQLVDKANRMVMSPLCKYNYLSREGSLSKVSYFKPNAITLVEAYIERYNDITQKYPEYPKLEKLSRVYIFDSLLYVVNKAYKDDAINEHIEKLENIIDAVRIYDIYNCGLGRIKEKILKMILTDVNKYSSFVRRMEAKE